MSRRFYLPQAFDVPRLVLEGAEAHHLLHVLRLGVGQDVILFDGRGIEALARIESVSQSTAELQIQELRTAATETPVPIILGTAVPKGDRFGWLVEKATELGVARLVPLNTQRSIVEPGAGKLEKMRQTVVAASKQSGRSRLMEIGAPTSWREFVEREFSEGDAFIAHPSGELLDQKFVAPARPIVVAIGPEGGFTEAEVAFACEHGGKLVCLGPRVLRIETAALVMAAFFDQCQTGK